MSNFKHNPKYLSIQLKNMHNHYVHIVYHDIQLVVLPLF